MPLLKNKLLRWAEGLMTWLSYSVQGQSNEGVPEEVVFLRSCCALCCLNCLPQKKPQIVYFTVVCWVSKPLSGSKAGVDLVLIQTLLLFICKHKLVSVRTTWFSCEKQWVLIKTGSTPASLPLKGQVTKHTTIKWAILFHSLFVIIQWLSIIIFYFTKKLPP